MPPFEKGGTVNFRSCFDSLFFKEMPVCNIGNNRIKGISEAEHQGNTDKRRLPNSAEIKNKESSIVNAVCHYRLKKHIVCLASSIESRIKNVLECVQNIEYEQYHYKPEQFIYVAISENMLHKRLIQWNCYHPYHAGHSRYRKIAEGIILYSILILSRFLLNKLSKLSYRQQHPAPDKVVCYPVCTLLPNHIDHTRDHEHIRYISDKRFKSRDTSNLEEILHPRKRQLFLLEQRITTSAYKKRRNQKQYQV